MSGSFPPLARAAELLGGEVRGDEVVCPGPGHTDADRSLSVKPSKDDPEGFTVHSFCGDDWRECRALARKKLGSPVPKHAKQKNGGGKAWTFIAEYTYPDAKGAPYSCVKRFIDGDGKKQFPQYHWDGTKWVKGKPKGSKVPYRLPELLAAPLTTTVYFCEGEQDADALAAQGFVATTASEGAAAKWDDALTPYFRDRRVVIVVDSDKTGRKHGQKVAKALAGVAASVKLVDLYPDRDDGSDVSNFLETDKVAAKFIKIVNDAPGWDPAIADEDTDKAKESETADEVKPDGDSDADDDADNKAVKRKQADILVELAETATLFHTAAGDGFADVDVSGHRETHKMRSKAFKSWLTHQYYMTTKGAPNSDAMQSALNVLEARAHFEGVEREVHLRVVEHAGKVYVDLADPQWRVVEIGADGWRIVSSPPVRFRRTQGMLPLPEPERGGSIDALRSLLNVKDDADFVLVVAWLLTALRGRGPFPVLVVGGEQGTAKTSFCKILRALVDPFSVEERAPPRSDHDLFIAANSSYLPAFDNLSSLPLWLSDTLSRLATGGGFTCRRLFSDDEEVLFHAIRPILLNGIPDVVVQPDLMSRSILLTLEDIPDNKRRERADVLAELSREHPRLLGALLDAVAHGLRRLPDIKLSRLPRMADFARWGAACEGAFDWPPGTFAAAYDENRDSAVGLTLQADPVATAVISLMSDRATWTGTASDLLTVLGLLVPPETQRRGKLWPTQAHFLAGKLRRAAPALRKVGIEVKFIREGRDRTRLVRLTTQARPQEDGNSASAASAASIDNDINGLQRTLTNGAASAASTSASAGAPQGPADAHADAQDAQAEASVRPNPLKNLQMDAADAADARFPTPSGDDGLDFPAFLRRCNQCGQLATPADPLNPYDWPDRPDGVLLHQRCEGAWFDSRGAV